MTNKTNRDKVISFLETYPEGIDDGQLTEKTGLKRRQ